MNNGQNKMIKNIGQFPKSECPSPKVSGIIDNMRKGNT